MGLKGFISLSIFFWMVTIPSLHAEKDETGQEQLRRIIDQREQHQPPAARLSKFLDQTRFEARLDPDLRSFLVEILQDPYFNIRNVLPYSTFNEKARQALITYLQNAVKDPDEASADLLRIADVVFEKGKATLPSSYGNATRELNSQEKTLVTALQERFSRDLLFAPPEDLEKFNSLKTMSDWVDFKKLALESTPENIQRLVTAANHAEGDQYLRLLQNLIDHCVEKKCTNQIQQIISSKWTSAATRFFNRFDGAVSRIKNIPNFDLKPIIPYLTPSTLAYEVETSMANQFSSNYSRFFHDFSKSYPTLYPDQVSGNLADAWKIAQNRYLDFIKTTSANLPLNDVYEDLQRLKLIDHFKDDPELLETFRSNAIRAIQDGRPLDLKVCMAIGNADPDFITHYRNEWVNRVFIKSLNRPLTHENIQTFEFLYQTEKSSDEFTQSLKKLLKSTDPHASNSFWRYFSKHHSEHFKQLTLSDPELRQKRQMLKLTDEVPWKERDQYVRFLEGFQGKEQTESLTEAFRTKKANFLKDTTQKKALLKFVDESIANMKQTLQTPHLATLLERTLSNLELDELYESSRLGAQKLIQLMKALEGARSLHSAAWYPLMEQLSKQFTALPIKSLNLDETRDLAKYLTRQLKEDFSFANRYQSAYIHLIRNKAIPLNERIVILDEWSQHLSSLSGLKYPNAHSLLRQLLETAPLNSDEFLKRIVLIEKRIGMEGILRSSPGLAAKAIRLGHPFSVSQFSKILPAMLRDLAESLAKDPNAAQTFEQLQRINRQLAERALAKEADPAVINQIVRNQEMLNVWGDVQHQHRKFVPTYKTARDAERVSDRCSVVKFMRKMLK